MFATAALLFGAITAAVVGPTSPVALGAVLLGVLGLAIGLTRFDRRVAAVGAVALFGGVLAAGAAGSGVERLLPATGTALLAWEFGADVFDARSELHGGTSDRVETLRVAVGAAVGAVVVSVVYACYRFLALDASPLGVVLLFVAVVMLTLALRE